jgi:hypothetical protein
LSNKYESLCLQWFDMEMKSEEKLNNVGLEEMAGNMEKLPNLLTKEDKKKISEKYHLYLCS